jgi:hypothetical protein
MDLGITMREFVRHALHRAGVLGPLRELRSGTVKKGEGASLARIIHEPSRQGFADPV